MSNTMILKDKSVQVSRIRRSSSFVMKRPHYHSYYEIYYLLSGKCKMFINQDIYYLEPGDITIIPPLEVHKALYEPSWQAERFGIYFSRDTVSSFLSLCGREAFGHIFSRPKRTIPPEFRPRIEELLAQMQDEVHRFAISYHRRLRKKAMTRSILDEVEGLGEVRKKAIWKKFGSLKNLRAASVEEIRTVVPEKVAENIYHLLHNLDQIKNDA